MILKYSFTYLHSSFSKCLVPIVLCILSTCLYANTKYDVSHSSAGFRAGSAGWGFEYKARVQPALDLRVVWQTLAPGRFNIDTASTTTALNDTSNYQGQGSFRSSGIISDWYPWSTPIRFSFGIFRNTSQFRLSEISDSSAPLNRYSAHFGKLAYFFGTGWAPRKNPNRLTLTLDVGLLAQQPPQVHWIADSNTRTLDQTNRIWSEKKRVTHELEQFKILPFFMIGLSYKIY